MEPNQKQEKSNGALIGLIVIIIILIIGGIYLWKNSIQEGAPLNSGVSDTSQTESDAANLEASVNNVDLDSLDSEI